MIPRTIGPSVVPPRQDAPSWPTEEKRNRPVLNAAHTGPKFSISILAVNGLEMTKQCIKSVMATAGDDFELLLTDNASTDGTAEFFDVATQCDKISVVHNQINRGFSEPNNEALARAKGRYFITLNNDTIVPPGWLEALEKPFLEFATAAISGPSGSCCSLAGRSEFFGYLDSLYEYVEGSCLCIPVKLARKFTLFAPYLHFAYGEDVDLSLRMRARGLTIHQVPFKIVHHRGVTARAITFPAGVHEHNQAMLMERWGGYHRYRRFDLPVIIRREAAFGDVLLLTPLIRALKQQQPSDIYIETKCREVFANNPHVKVTQRHQVIPFHIWQAARVIDLDMAYENMTETHIVDAYFEKALIIPSEPDYRRTEIYFTSKDQAWAERELPSNKYVAVHAGASTWRGKEWNKFSRLCTWLEENNWKVVLVGSGIQFLSHTVDLRGRTTPSQLAGALKRCQFFIGIDSFPLHVAESVGIPAIGLFGVTDPRFIMNDSSFAIMGSAECAGERHRVKGKTCVQCNGACIDSISLEEVIEKVQQVESESAIKPVKIYSRAVPARDEAPIRYKEEMSVVPPYQ